MKISTKSRYALRIMIYLAEHYTLGYISVASIAEAADLSIKYTEQIMSKLKKAGFIVAARGSHGGYKLFNTPENYNIYQIITTMEIFSSITPCATAEATSCPRYDTCVSVDIWQLVQSTVKELLENITLLDLLRMQQEKTNTPSLYLTYLTHIKK